MSEAAHVLDASALLAILGDEPGADEIPGGSVPMISAVNLLEVSIVLTRRGISARKASSILDALALEVVPFEGALIERATTIHAKARDRGLSLGDAACLATAHAHGATAWTADRAWKGLEVGVAIRLLRAT